MKKIFVCLLLISILLPGFFFLTPSPSFSGENEYNRATIYFFWGVGCPYCEQQKEFLERMQKQYPEIKIKSKEVVRNKANRPIFRVMGRAYGIEATSVPITFIGDFEPVRGFNKKLATKLEERIKHCLENHCVDPAVQAGLREPVPEVLLGAININTATAAQLQQVDGVGPSTASNIIDYRQQHGPFSSVDELTNISRISPATLRNMKKAAGMDIAVYHDSEPIEGPININVATAAQLQKLHRIGPTTARIIIQYREEQGPFNSVDDLINVYGIGPVTLRHFRAQATTNESLEVVHTLLETGMKIDAQDYLGRTALMRAAGDENPEAVRVLLEAGAEVNIRDKKGNSALILATESNEDTEVIRILLEAGAKLNARDYLGRTALMKAVKSNDNFELVRILLDAGADVNIRDEDGKSVMDHAKDNEHLVDNDVYWELHDKCFE